MSLSSPELQPAKPPPKAAAPAIGGAQSGDRRSFNSRGVFSPTLAFYPNKDSSYGMNPRPVVLAANSNAGVESRQSTPSPADSVRALKRATNLGFSLAANVAGCIKRLHQSPDTRRVVRVLKSNHRGLAWGMSSCEVFLRMLLDPVAACDCMVARGEDVTDVMETLEACCQILVDGGFFVAKDSCLEIVAGGFQGEGLLDHDAQSSRGG